MAAIVGVLAMFLDIYKRLMTLPESSRNELNAVFNSVGGNGKSQKISRAVVEKANRNWDQAKESVAAQTISLMQAYSVGADKKSGDILENYYDSVTEIVSDLDGVALSYLVRTRIVKKLDEKSRIFVKDIHAVIREACPLKA